MESSGSKSDDCSSLLVLSQAINHLGIQLYQKLTRERENLFFSPLSLSCALSMLFCGSRNDTAEDMRHVLGYEIADILDEDVKSCFQLLLSSLEKTPDSYTLSIANVVFSQSDFIVKEEFKTLLMESFKAMTLEADFRNESAKAVKHANEWVKNKTNGMIPRLLDSLDPATVMVILNAVYFKGFWKQQFKTSSTRPQTFYNRGLETNSKQVEMMHMKESFPFVEKETFKALQLPYKGDEIAMLVLLPNKRDGLEELESKLSSDFVSKLKTEMVERNVNISLPKFRLEYSKEMKSNFQCLGMSSVFCRGANFSGISDSKDLLVSEIIHKAVLEVNEEGSEAAAATAVIMMMCSLSYDPDFIVNHPFLFLIFNSKTNLILFMGTVHEL